MADKKTFNLKASQGGNFYVIFLAVPLLLAPYLVTNRKGLILHERNIDHVKIFEWWSRGSHFSHGA